MKKYLLVLITVLCFNYIYSQVLYTENFNNHSVGNLGTDVTGKIPGQWGWYTGSAYTQANSFFTIENETGRGKVLNISTGLTYAEALGAWKTNLHPLMANHLPGNDVLMFEIDFYTGPKHPGNAGGYANIRLYSIGDPNSPINPPEGLANIAFMKTNGIFYDGSTDGNQHFYLPFNTWVKLIVYLDYPNKKVYYHTPSLNKVSSRDFLKYKTSTNLIQDYPLSNIVIDVIVSTGANDPQIYSRNRYDNIKITALNAVPPEVISLSTNEQLAAKFNMYPNPAATVVNITNSENMLVNQVTVYNMAGKQVSTQNFNNETEIQLNVENLASGTYMLHLQTNEGTAVKKLVKK
ncbi:Por secretion system C-terminal sorting domain-containing protein [Paenimyroides ummariense]|uniref:Por secretion system C-terminal sorting domain-containing protein n=1 Tax=Paenimyroides ummariense TaxID=913024 RepID=A0A1I5E694_9FLAO|nr:T9SS type A sorting domain-containing protein [Paenimyroides ummariense]SFO07055.1 Por secretion system C-terminal sorting domain-containing protein [Paenimyroides ummariense]